MNNKRFIEAAQNAETSIRLAELLHLADAEFKNFHRLLCERFGYVHDPIDWKRDQLSLIEHIASQSTSAGDGNG